MTLAQIRRAYPHLFYADQHWYEGEAFMDLEPRGTLPDCFKSTDLLYSDRQMVGAADFAAAYVRSPMDARWALFYWTDDLDRFGSRVYVGGVGQYGIPHFQIHRALTPNCYYVRAA